MTQGGAFNNLQELLFSDRDLAYSILDLIPAGISITTNQRCTEILHNRKGAEFFRIQPWENLSHSASPNQSLKLFKENRELTPDEMPIQRACWKGEEVKDEEIMLLWEDGIQKYASFNASPIYGKGGEIIGAVASFKDITQRKQVEQDLNTTVHYLDSILKSIPDLIFRCNREGMILDVIAIPDESILYLPSEEFPGKRIRDVLPAEVANKFEDAIDQTLYSGNLTVFGYSLEVPAGYLHFEARIANLNQQEVILLLEDITRRQQAENALKESEQKYREILSTMEEGYYEVDLAGHFIFFNDSLCSILGYTSEKLKQITYKNLYKYPKEVFKIYNRVFRTAKPEKAADLKIITENGQTRYIEVSISLRWDDEGNPIGFKGVAKDVTERKESERKLADYAAELEQMYSLLDAELDKARQVHERTLPKHFPDIAGISFAAHYQPARKLGGDFYNLIQLENKLIIYLSDVTGHGLEGALLSVFIKEVINSYITLRGDKLKPAEILAHLDQKFRGEHFPEEYLISIFISVLDLESLELHYSGAGFHTAPLVRYGNGLSGELVVQGLPVSAIIPETLREFPEKTAILDPGTTILFSTDGLAEQQAPKDPFEKRLYTVFQEKSHLSPEAIVQAINDEFKLYNDGHLQGDDDITFLVMRIDPMLVCFRNPAGIPFSPSRL